MKKETSVMRHYVKAVSMGLVFALIVTVVTTGFLTAQAPGDVGSPECRAVQLETQAAVDAGGPYKNHGQMVRTAANTQDPYLEAGDITEECSSCIMNQFARKIAIADQTACGPD